jgi:phosphotransferase system IIB component
MLGDDAKSLIEKATVTISIRGGRGVLVNSGFILTAAHCLNYTTEGDMVLDGHNIEKIDTCLGKFKVAIKTVEPVNDIAALNSLDNQEFWKEASEYQDFCNNTTPVKIAEPLLEATNFPVFIFTHKGTWLKAIAETFGFGDPVISFECEEQIEAGTSGSAIVNEAGELVAIVSNTNVIDEHMTACHGSSPQPLLALPVWVCNAINETEA